MTGGRSIIAAFVAVSALLSITGFSTAFEEGAGAGTQDFSGWVRQENRTANASFNAVRCANATTAWVFGDNGTVLHTANAGDNWTNQSSPTGMQILKVSYLDNLHIWFTAGTFGQVATSSVFVTSDGGKNWSEQTNAFMTAATMPGICFADKNSGWVVGDDGSKGLIIHSDNGGKTWKSQMSGTAYGLYDVDFTDANTGWAVGWRGVVLHTVNGGLNWTTQNSGILEWLEAVDFTDGFNGTAVARGGKIIHTTDGGLTWTPQDSGTANNLWAVDFISSTEGWAVGDGGTIIHTSDGGQTWFKKQSGTTVPIRGVSFTNSKIGWVVGVGSLILHTTSGGGPDIANTPEIGVPAFCATAVFAVCLFIIIDRRRR